MNLDAATDVVWTTAFQDGRRAAHGTEAPWWGIHVGS